MRSAFVPKPKPDALAKSATLATATSYAPVFDQLFWPLMLPVVYPDSKSIGPLAATLPIAARQSKAKRHMEKMMRRIGRRLPWAARDRRRPGVIGPGQP